jgi:hypothetical protein
LNFTKMDRSSWKRNVHAHGLPRAD